MRQALKIYLSDLANTYYGISPGTIPLASGYLAAHLYKQFPGEVDVTIFRTLPPLLEAVQAAPPDIAGFSIYAWNPLLLKEINNSHHIDIVCTLLLTLFVLALIRQRGYIAMLMLMLAAFVKLTPVLLVPQVSRALCPASTTFG